MSRPLVLAVLLAAAPVYAQLFQPAGSVPFGQNNFYAVADFNLDGRPDIVRANAFQSELTLYLGAADGTFALSPSATTPIETPTALVPGDFDHDGRTDLIVLTDALFAQPTLRMLLNPGTGAFAPRPALVLQALARKSAAGDFDQDGNLDLAIVTTTSAGASNLSVLRGDGKGTLATSFATAPVAIPVPSGSVFGDIRVTDLNRDGRLDLILTVSSTSGVGLATALGDGRGSFAITATMGTQPPLTRPNPRMALGDFNGDRNLDVIMFGYLRDQVTLWFNSGGVLVPQLASSGPVGANPYGIAAADFDLDGRADWAVGRQTGLETPELHVGLGNGAGSFLIATGSPYPFGGSTPLVEAADFNGDRRPDLLVVEGESANLRALLNIVPRPPTLLIQQIQFAQPEDRGLNAGPFTLTASASSGLPVTFAGLTSSVCTVSKGIVTMVALGTCTVAAIQQGDAFYSPAPMVQRSFLVAPNTQTITFAVLPERTLDASPFTVSATASSGLPVTFTASPSTVCTVSGATVTLIAVGQCSLTASQLGNATFPPAPPITRTFAVTPVIPVGPVVESIKNSASYAVGTLAPASFGSLFGIRLTGATLRLRDSAGTLHTPELIFSGPTQINFIVPTSTARGAATVTVTTPFGAAEFPLSIEATAPGLFSADFTGQGLAAAQALLVNPNGSVTTLTVGNGPIPVGNATEIYLVLYGTGIRGRSLTGVFATVAGAQAEVLYAGSQGTFPALDQVNLRVPLTVRGRGTVEIRVFVDGVAANVVTAFFQ